MLRSPLFCPFGGKEASPEQRSAQAARLSHRGSLPRLLPQIARTPRAPGRSVVGVAAPLERQQPAAIAGPEIERFERILAERIVSAVAGEGDLEACRQRLHGAGRPAVGQIGTSEVGAGDDKLIAALSRIIGVHAPMRWTRCSNSRSSRLKT